MKSASNYYYICEKGHITVGETKQKKKCDQKIQHVKLVKSGKNKVEKEVVKTDTCGCELKKIIDIPKELDLFKEWDYHTVKAFMINQNYESLKVGFMQSLQKHMSTLYGEIGRLNEELKEIRTWKNKTQ